MISGSEVQKIKKELGASEDRSSKIFDALGDRTRFQIIKLLVSHPELCVSELAKVLDVSVPAVSQQLRVLEMTGLVRKIKKGQMVCYEVEEKEPLMKSLLNFLKRNLGN